MVVREGRKLLVYSIFLQLRLVMPLYFFSALYTLWRTWQRRNAFSSTNLHLHLFFVPVCIINWISRATVATQMTNSVVQLCVFLFFPPLGRCGPCLRVAPAFNALSNKYPQATFLEVDVHQCQVCSVMYVYLADYEWTTVTDLEMANKFHLGTHWLQ